MGLVDTKTKKRLEGVADLAKTVARRNPVVHTLLATKEVGDAAYKIRHGKDPSYLKFLRRYRPTPKRNKYSASKTTQLERYLIAKQRQLPEEDPLKRAYKAARASGDYETARLIKRVMA
jgi:hypothetical protein